MLPARAADAGIPVVVGCASFRVHWIAIDGVAVTA
jgi:hypothetical protein